MRKLLIASVCTLVLSLSSVLGIVSDNQTKAVAYAAEATDTGIEKGTPDNKDATSKVKKVTSRKSVKKTSAKKSKKNSKKTRQTLVYNNIDLSNCNSTKDVVAVLQKNGYKNINVNNIKNVKSLQNILAIVNENKSTGSNTTPTTKPVTTKPVTTKPVTTKPVTTKPDTTTPTTTKPSTTPVATTPAPATKPVSSSDTTNMSSYAKEVLRLVNIERAKAGLSAFTTNSTLSAAANKRAQEIVQSFSHTRPNGTGFQTVLKEYGVTYRAAGENIAWGQKSPQEVVTGWMNSPGHRANILNGNFNKLGIGVYQKNGTYYWTQVFTN